ncbi:MAG: hypothetical protein M3370_06930 [Actinomycetota bacterium]|nr:hypothetical protein [Actinomycetota bacterium]
MPRRDVAVFTTALVPGDDGLRALIGALTAKELAAVGIAPREALDRVAAAAREVLADGPLERDAFHQALRERLPDALLPWCRGCQSHHVRPGLARAQARRGPRRDGRVARRAGRRRRRGPGRRAPARMR